MAQRRPEPGDPEYTGAAPAETLAVAIWRGGERGRYVEYGVPADANQTVLDVVTYVQRHLEPSLGYRFACRVGVCGSCAMTVNGRPRWTCRTHVSKVSGAGRLEIGPLANLPVIKDLATDMSRFFEKWQSAHGRFVPSATRHDDIPKILPSSPARVEANKAIECINCAVCFSACDTVRWNKHYAGPAALNRACHPCSKRAWRDWAGQTLKDLANGVGDAAKKAAGAIKDFIDARAEFALKLGKDLIASGSKAFMEVAKAWKDNLTEGGKVFLDGLKDLGSAGVDALKDLAKLGGQVARYAVDKLESLAKAGIGYARDALGALADFGGEVGRLAGKTVDAIADFTDGEFTVGGYKVDLNPFW